MDFAALQAILRNNPLRPLAVCGWNARQIAVAMATGLVHTIELLPPRSDAPQPAKAAPCPRQDPAAFPSLPTGALVIDKVPRCGQQLYAWGRCPIVMAMVNADAEIVADGHSTSMRRCAARPSPGAQGNTNARIFALSLEPEMVSIAGIYETGDPPAHQGLHGQPAQVSRLSDPDGDRFVVDRVSR